MSGDYAGVMVEVTRETFDREVLASSVPVVVDFWAPWCKPCEAIEPHLRALAEAWDGRARLVRVNVDEQAGLSGRYGVLSLPTVILFAGGEPKATVHGAQPRARFEREFGPFV
jgi:thioredoxin